jgi:hypothetical protein
MRNLLSSLSVVAREEITPEEDEEQLIMRRMHNYCPLFQWWPERRSRLRRTRNS